ncbi:hypothetical protein [Microseira wollei]|nr:hypothetical protein [Microseira wollei]
MALAPEIDAESGFLWTGHSPRCVENFSASEGLGASPCQSQV